MFLTLHPTTTSARKILQDGGDWDSAPQRRGNDDDAAGFLPDVPAGSSAEEDATAALPKDETHFGADSDALVGSWSQVSPARQVAASSSSSSSSENEEVMEAQPEEQQGEATNNVAVEDTAVPDDGLFDEDTPSQPIVTAVNPDEFLEPPSADKKHAEVVEEDLFDEDTPEIPIVTAVDPQEFLNNKDKKKGEVEEEKTDAVEEEKLPKQRKSYRNDGDASDAADESAGPASKYVDVDAMADAENAEKPAYVDVDAIADAENAKKQPKEEEEEEVKGEASALSLSSVESDSAPAPSPAPTPESEDAAAPAESIPESESESVPAAATEAPAEAPKDAIPTATSADEWHAKKGHGRRQKKAAAGIKAKKAEASAAEAPVEAPVKALVEALAEAPAAEALGADAPAVAEKEDEQPSPSSSSRGTEKKMKDDDTASVDDGEKDEAASAPGPAPAPVPEEEVAAAAAPESSPSVDADAAAAEKSDSSKRKDSTGSGSDADSDSDSEALASAGAATDGENPTLLSKSDLSEEPEDVVELVKKVASYPSDCVPDATAVLVQVNYHHIPLFHAQVKNVIQRRCFMRRYVLLALDGKSMDECRKIQANGVELHCAKSKREYTAAGSAGGGGGADGALSADEMKDILFDRWTVVANVLEAAPNLKLWVFDADVVIFKVPTLELPDGCDFSTQLDKLEALGAADVELVQQREEMMLSRGDGSKGGVGDAATSDDSSGSMKSSDSGGSKRRLLLKNAPTLPALSLVPHKEREKYNINGGQVVLHSSKEVISYLRAVGKRGENSDDLDYLVMTQLMLDAAGKEWESMTTCDLPETFSSACWGLAIDPFTFHANCIESAKEKLKQMHNAVGLIASTVSPSTGEVTFAEGYPEGTKRYCWDEGMMCKGSCSEGKLCEIDEDTTFLQ